MPLGDSARDYSINQEYFVGWIDDPSYRSINKGHSDSNIFSIIVEPYIFSVGHNDDFIIAKQFGGQGVRGLTVDTTKTAFYIIDISENHPREIVYGPLSETEFDNLRIRFGIEKITFNKTFPLN